MGTKDNITQIKDIVNSVLEKIEAEDQKVSIEVRQKEGCVDKNFEITHRDMYANFVIAGNEPIDKVKCHIIKNTKLNCGLFFGSINNTSEATGVCRRTVVKVFNILQYDDFLRLYMDGVWAVHPKLLRRGNGGKYLGQLRFYYSLPKKEEPECKKKKDESTIETKIHKLY